jgi:hypothetical protein
MVQAQKEEDALKRQERAQNLDMFNSMYGTYAQRNPVTEEIPVQTKDF